MEKSDTDSLEEWDVVTVSQVLETGTTNKAQDEPTQATTVITGVKNGSESPAREESPTGTPDADPAEPKNATVAQPEDRTQAVPEQCTEEEPRSESESQGEESKASSPEPESQILAVTADEPKSGSPAGDEMVADSDISANVEEEKSASSENECGSETIEQETDKDAAGYIAERESSPDDIGSGSCQEPETEDVLEHLVKKIDAERELAAIDSSSSDIDIIDEVMEESTISTSLMSSPLSLSISSSVADASSMASTTSQFVNIQHYNQEPREEPKRESIAGREERQKAKEPDHPRTSRSEKRSKKSPSPRQSSGTTRRTIYDWVVLLLQFLQNMSPYDWCIIGTVAVSLYLTVIFNQTNIFAFVQKDDVMSQMKHMIEELKHDNKILKEQMMSEIKNEKAFSSFEHQIKELRKENSKLNHMLYDVAKVLDKQKDFQEKKEAEYLAPFKKEINKLKEYINVLKIDNEELQKEMVRMRYSGSQSREKETPPKEDVQLDIESLKKWNELITLLSKELGVLAEADVLKGQRSGKDSKPFWKDLLNNFKSSFNNFRKTNLSELFSEYKEAKKKVVSDIYLLVKDFFTPEENPSADEDDSQWRSVGDFMEDLKGKWTNIKDRLYASDLRKFFEKGAKRAEAPPAEERRSTAERVKTRTTYDRQESRSKPEGAGTQEEDTRWVFDRAADREEQRGSTEEEEEANWFLKRGQHNSEDKGHRRL